MGAGVDIERIARIEEEREETPTKTNATQPVNAGNRSPAAQLGGFRSACSSVEHHCLVAVNKDAILQMPADRLREDDFLQVPASAH